MKRSELLEILEQKMTVQNYALESFKAYRSVANAFFSFMVGHPELKKQVPERRIEAYLSARVTENDISPSTQNVEFNALIYIHRHVFGVEVKGIDAVRARPRLRIPPILNREQVWALLNGLPERYQLIGKLLYGSGLRVNEALRLRIKDVDFSLMKLAIHQAKGDKERLVPIPEVLKTPLANQYNWAVNLWRVDCVAGYGVHLPRALEKKYKNHWLSKEWYWLFPAESTSKDPRTKREQRHHLKDFKVQRAFSEVRERLELPAYATPHSLRHAFATHLAEDMLNQKFPQAMVESKLIEYLGHATKDMLKYYLHLSAPREAVITLPIEQLAGE